MCPYENSGFLVKIQLILVSIFYIVTAHKTKRPKDLLHELIILKVDVLTSIFCVHQVGLDILWCLSENLGIFIICV